MKKLLSRKKFSTRRRGGKRRRSAEGGEVARLLERGGTARWVLGFFVYGMSVLIVAWRGVPFDLPAEGEVSHQDVVATIDFSFPDHIKTDQALKALISRQPFAYVINDKILAEKEDTLKSFFKALTQKPPFPSDFESASSFSPLSPQQVSILAQASNPGVIEEEVLALLRRAYGSGILPPDVKETLINTGRQRIVLSDGKRDEEIDRIVSSVFTPEQARIAIAQSAREVWSSDDAFREAVVGLLGNLLEPNLEFDRDKTDDLRDQARKSFAPMITTVSKGEKVLRQGEVVKPLHIQKLRAYQEELFRLRPPSSRFYYAAGNALLIFLLFFITVYFLGRYHRRIIQSNSTLLMLSAIVLVVLVMARALHHVSWYLSPRMLEYFRYVSPVAVGSLLLCLLLGVRVAVFITLILTFLTAMILSYDVGYLLVGVIGGLTGVFSISRARKRSELLRAGAAVAGVNCLTVVALGILNGLKIEIFLKQSLGSILGAIGSAFITLITLGILETGFRVFSDIGLLELSDLNHPLLRQMMIKAPGTYHHSLMVATLAEGAAAAVGANPLLGRVGAYFHDIGKIAKPEYFSENETSGGSHHDVLIPSMSSLILVSHVKEGINLARKHRLDKRIVEIIQQHHGTSLISYFYDRAERVQQMKFDVLEKDYRYPGPRPSSPEAAIVMLADAAEAASASLDRPTPARLESLVKSIIQERFLDSQLDECDLTLNHLKRIGETFVRLLSARFHTRVKYPDANSQEEYVG